MQFYIALTKFFLRTPSFPIQGGGGGQGNLNWMPGYCYMQTFQNSSVFFFVNKQDGSSSNCRTSDFFQDWWAKVTHAAKNGGSFSEMMGPSISN